MAGRFPDIAPIPTVHPGPGRFPDPPPAPGTVSFTRKPVSGAQTIDALQRRQRELAERQAAQATQAYPGQGTIAGGLGHLIDRFTTGLGEHRAQEEEALGREELAAAIGGIDYDTGPTQEQIAAIYRRDPETGMALMADAIKSRRDLANQETFAVLTPEEEIAEGLDTAGTYQRSSLDKKISKVGGDGTNVTINPPSAETGGKLGLAKGFTDNYESILRSAEAGEMTGGGYISSVQLGRGSGGEAYRNLLQGTEAMVRLLTGAGMNESEARQRVVQYEPAFTDDVPTLVSKIKGLKQALDNVSEGVKTRGAEDGETPEEPDAATPEPAPFEVGKVYTFKQGKAKYLGGEIGDPSSWEQVVP